jgi:hypothetical protein
MQFGNLLQRKRKQFTFGTGAEGMKFVATVVMDGSFIHAGGARVAISRKFRCSS